MEDLQVFSRLRGSASLPCLDTAKTFKTNYTWCLLFLFRLEEYSAETAIAMVVDGDAKLKINTEHLREISFRIGSIYQFIGELLIQPDNQAVLQARVGRNVDGINLSLYHQSLQLLRQFEANRLKNPMT
ncbi:hypothetical protein L484_002723 [Morus notabilis]|uniref:CST complex subunit TEN1 n=1 Tax=Morus notabilis TaxID=981085 RepID=W9RL85_9ROSA|nr:CST complex subunit TEN1 [Morus notabilis]EXB83120.1 hypothetical protein L484_002723 [Morus notabilis]